MSGQTGTEGVENPFEAYDRLLERKAGDQRRNEILAQLAALEAELDEVDASYKADEAALKAQMAAIVRKQKASMSGRHFQAVFSRRVAYRSIVRNFEPVVDASVEEWTEWNTLLEHHTREAVSFRMKR